MYEVGQSGAAQQHHGLAAHARPELLDLRIIDVTLPLRMREHEVERRGNRERSQCLHRREVAQVRQHGKGVAEVIDREDGKAQVAVKRRDYNVPVTCEMDSPENVVAGDRAAGVAM